MQGVEASVAELFQGDNCFSQPREDSIRYEFEVSGVGLNLLLLSVHMLSMLVEEDLVEVSEACQFAELCLTSFDSFEHDAVSEADQITVRTARRALEQILRDIRREMHFH